jgi:hypothetical protein
MDNSARGWLRQGFALAILLSGAHAGEAATTRVRAGDDLQAALNAAQPGDTLLLDSGAIFTGNFVLPVKPGSQTITVMTDDSRLPGAGVRVSPSAASMLAKVQSGNTMPALHTAPGAHHWRLVLLEFPANRDGYGEIIQLGDGSSAQNALSQVPYEIELDRVYVHGHSVMGQKRGIALNAGAVTIRNSWIADIKGVGMDTQAIGGWNGPGPFVVENNYLEAAGENFMLGGADPSIPNLVSENVVIRNNHFSRPLAWRAPIVPTPTGIGAVTGTGGSLSAGTHTYRVVARTAVAAGVVARSTASEELAVQSPASGRIVLSWATVANATSYYVYKRSPSGVQQYWTVSGPTFTDSGAAGTSGSAPASTGDVWTVKNLLELKNARNVVIEQNLFENHWASAQAGYSIVFTPRNQEGGCPWCVVEDVTFRQNVVRNVAAGINILGYDNIAASQQTKRIRITQNLFQKITQTLGGSGWFLLLGNGPRDITIDHNTIDADGSCVSYVYGGADGGILPVSGFRFTNNAAHHNDYGIAGAEVSFGQQIIAAFFGDGEVRGNWLQGGYASSYPSGNYFDGSFSSAFVDEAGGNYAADAAGPLAGRATDGTNIGADMIGLTSALASVGEATASHALLPPTNVRVIVK